MTVKARLIDAKDFEALATVLAENNILANGLGGLERKYFAFQDENGWRLGVGGLELYGEVGLLNAFITMSCHRNGRISGQMLEELIACAHSLGVRRLCLFSRDDDDFFIDHAFKSRPSAAAPESLRANALFKDISSNNQFMIRDLA